MRGDIMVLIHASYLGDMGLRLGFLYIDMT